MEETAAGVHAPMEIVLSAVLTATIARIQANFPAAVSHHTMASSLLSHRSLAHIFSWQSWSHLVYYFAVSRLSHANQYP